MKTTPVLTHTILRTALTASAVLLAGLTAARAQTFVPALQFTSASLNPANTNTTRGYSFDVTATTGVLVGGLSIYDFGADGLAQSHDAGLWNSAGTLLASGTVPAGTAAPWTRLASAMWPWLPPSC